MISFLLLYTMSGVIWKYYDLKIDHTKIPQPEHQTRMIFKHWYYNFYYCIYLKVDALFTFKSSSTHCMFKCLIVVISVKSSTNLSLLVLFSYIFIIEN